jgi:hypothetical protein
MEKNEKKRGGGFYHGMMEDVLNDESENISLSQLLDIPTQQLH